MYIVKMKPHKIDNFRVKENIIITMIWLNLWMKVTQTKVNCESLLSFYWLVLDLQIHPLAMISTQVRLDLSKSAICLMLNSLQVIKAFSRSLIHHRSEMAGCCCCWFYGKYMYLLFHSPHTLFIHTMKIKADLFRKKWKCEERKTVALAVPKAFMKFRLICEALIDSRHKYD